VWRERDGWLGLVVDEVGEVLHVPAEQLTPRPVGGGRMRRMVLLGEELLTVLEPEELSVHGR
jgi:purine-binding chemotaxis protein CheW